MTDQIVTAPDWPILADDLMSNFDQEVDIDVAQRLQEEQVKAPYPGWNFYAMCWFSDGQYHAEVWRYNSHVATMSAATPRDLMAVVSDEYGWR